MGFLVLQISFVLEKKIVSRLCEAIVVQRKILLFDSDANFGVVIYRHRYCNSAAHGLLNKRNGNSYDLVLNEVFRELIDSKAKRTPLSPTLHQ